MLPNLPYFGVVVFQPRVFSLPEFFDNQTKWQNVWDKLQRIHALSRENVLLECQRKEKNICCMRTTHNIMMISESSGPWSFVYYNNYRTLPICNFYGKFRIKKNG